MFQWPSDAVLHAIISQCYFQDPAKILPSVLKLKPYLYYFRFASDYNFALALRELIGSLCRCPDHERETYAQELADQFGADPDACLAPGVERLPMELEEVEEPSVVNELDVRVETDCSRDEDVTYSDSVELSCDEVEPVIEESPPTEVLTPIEEAIAAKYGEIVELPPVIVPKYVEEEYHLQFVSIRDECVQALAIRDFCQRRNLRYTRKVLTAAYHRAQSHNQDLPPLPPGRRASDKELRLRCTECFSLLTGQERSPPVKTILQFSSLLDGAKVRIG